jgi:hypothetical protein
VVATRTAAITVRVDLKIVRDMILSWMEALGSTI